jgi:hypothetical protein
MNKLKFNSQVCTSVEQSKRLLDLGLKSETADMCIDLYYEDEPFVVHNKIDYSKQIEFVPAWSLHRLLELCPDCQIDVGNKYATFYYREWDMDAEDFQMFENTYDNVIECIKWLISEGYFNKEYLKQ